MATQTVTKTKVMNMFLQHGTLTVNAAGIGQILDFGPIPSGMRVVRLDIAHGALGTDVTLKAGITSNDDVFLGATAAATAAVLTADTLAEGSYTKIGEDERLILTTGGATTASSNITVNAYAWLVPDYEA